MGSPVIVRCVQHKKRASRMHIREALYMSLAAVRATALVVLTQPANNQSQITSLSEPHVCCRLLDRVRRLGSPDFGRLPVSRIGPATHAAVKHTGSAINLALLATGFRRRRPSSRPPIAINGPSESSACIIGGIGRQTAGLEIHCDVTLSQISLPHYIIR